MAVHGMSFTLILIPDIGCVIVSFGGEIIECGIASALDCRGLATGMDYSTSSVVCGTL